MNLKRDVREKLSIGTCLASFTLGWMCTLVGFFVPPLGVVSDSVLWVLGQSLLYTGAVIGLDFKLKDMKEKIDEHLNDKSKN